MHEVIVNLHMHTCYSDGAGVHQDIARAALRAAVDVVIVTDHNVLARGLEGYYREGDRRVLMLVGEEIHDQARTPQKNHLLVLGVDRELATSAADPQTLIDQVREAGGLSFLAHPFEQAAPIFHQPDISWEDWSVQGFSGLEIWNALSELKTVIPSRLRAAFHACFPAFVAHGPPIPTLEKWDAYLASGRRVVAIGGSDAHATRHHLGPLSRVVFPYEFHFRCVNTHLLLWEPLTGTLQDDRRSVLAALREGRCYVGYDLPASTSGFRFTAHGREQIVTMGQEIPHKGGVTLQSRVPAASEMRLIRDGVLVARWANHPAFTHTAPGPGAYRVEVYRRYLGRRRGWIFSNPIYVR